MLAAALAAILLAGLTACSAGDVTKEVDSGLAELKSQAAQPAVDNQPTTPAQPKTDPEPAADPTPSADPEPAADPEPSADPAPAAENPNYPSAAGLNTQTLEAFGTDYTLTLNVTCPDKGW